MIDYGDLNQFHWERPLDFDASDVVIVSSSNNQGNSKKQAKKHATFDTSKHSNSDDDDNDPDAALKEGALCLVDPNGVVSFTLPLLSSNNNNNNNNSSQLNSSWETSRASRSVVDSPAFSPGAQAATESMWTTTQKAVLATPRRLGNRFAEAMGQTTTGRPRWPARNPETPLHEPNIPDNCAVM